MRRTLRTTGADSGNHLDEAEAIVQLPHERQQETRCIEVALVDPLHTVRAGLDLLLQSNEGIEVVAQAASADEALADLTELGRATDLLVLLGLGLTGEHDSFWLIRQIRELFPPAKIVALGANSDKLAISRAFFTGADCFIDKNAEPRDFIDGLRRASAGEVVIVGPPREWIGSIAEEVGRQSDDRPALSPREQEVISLAAEGLTARDMGTCLGLSERTVTTHLQRIYSKLGVSSRIAAVQAALGQGFIVPREIG